MAASETITPASHSEARHTRPSSIAKAIQMIVVLSDVPVATTVMIGLP